jgi:hypothetical protein
MWRARQSPCATIEPDPARIADEKLLVLDAPKAIKLDHGLLGALDRATHEASELIDRHGVLLGDQSQQVELAAVRRLRRSVFRSAGLSLRAVVRSGGHGERQARSCVLKLFEPSTERSAAGPVGLTTRRVVTTSR